MDVEERLYQRELDDAREEHAREMEAEGRNITCPVCSGKGRIDCEVCPVCLGEGFLTQQDVDNIEALNEKTGRVADLLEAGEVAEAAKLLSEISTPLSGVMKAILMMGEGVVWQPQK